MDTLSTGYKRDYTPTRCVFANANWIMGQTRYTVIVNASAGLKRLTLSPFRLESRARQSVNYLQTYFYYARQYRGLVELHRGEYLDAFGEELVNVGDEG